MEKWLLETPSRLTLPHYSETERLVWRLRCIAASRFELAAQFYGDQSVPAHKPLHARNRKLLDLLGQKSKL
jgi:hypothetical protein